jgi:hypothetical protein
MGCVVAYVCKLWKYEEGPRNLSEMKEGENNIDNKQEKLHPSERTRTPGWHMWGGKQGQLISLWRVASTTSIPGPMMRLAAVLFVVIGWQ